MRQYLCQVIAVVVLIFESKARIATATVIIFMNMIDGFLVMFKAMHIFLQPCIETQDQAQYRDQDYMGDLFNHARAAKIRERFLSF